MRGLDWVDQMAIAPGTKGVPMRFWDRRLGDVRGAGWRVLDGDAPLPAATVKRSAMAHNLEQMARFSERNGVALAPHGKTTLCPEIFQRQMAAGAWGITVATAGQALLCARSGIRRIFIANQVTDAHSIAALAQLCASEGGVEVYSLADSVAGANALNEQFALAGATANVLIEIGLPGGRCGCRTDDEVRNLARHIGTLDHVRLCGLEAFEGLTFRDAPENVRGFLGRVVTLFGAFLEEDLFPGTGPILLTAGGSAYYDLVVEAFARFDGGRVRRILRSGCYVVHDDGVYQELGPVAAARGVAAAVPDLKPALEVWCSVLSVPEPGLAIVNAGKRDLGFDIDLPRPKAHYRPERDDAPQGLSGVSLTKMSDQHGFLKLPPGLALAIGDAIGLGVSHPCTTLDKWPVLLEVDDDYRVLGALRTFF